MRRQSTQYTIVRICLMLAVAAESPPPGSFFEAARDLGIDLTGSWAIGDSARDVQAANRAGVKAILLNRSLPDTSATPASPLRFLRATGLLDAVRIVLNTHSYAEPEFMMRPDW
jgi:histidinol phosphatase-like enzyme